MKDTVNKGNSTQYKIENLFTKMIFPMEPCVTFCKVFSWKTYEIILNSGQNWTENNASFSLKG